MDSQQSQEYRPQPLDTSGTKLDPALDHLTELLAQNAHALWAQARIAEGWVYGPTRDDSRKEHPCLVPYEGLPESEKQYDRGAVVGTIKALIAFGYHVSPGQAEPVGLGAGSRVGEADIAALVEQLGPSSSLHLGELLAVWRGHSEQRWAAYPELYCRLGTRLLERGSPLLAHDVLSEGMRFWPRHARLRQLLGLALARSGATQRASAVLRQLCHEGNEDEETLAILARTHKDLAVQAVGSLERQRQLQLAHALYLRAYRLTGGSYSGVNAATTALLLGQKGTAEALAREVGDSCHTELVRREAGGEDCYYELAMLGEVALILGHAREAERWYARAAAIGRRRFGDLASTRRNARLIMEASGGGRGWVDGLLPVPRVVVFAGRMIDRPGRPTPRFPPDAEGPVAEAMAERLKALNAGFGFSSAACGGDILFLEAVGECQGETTVVLPYDHDQFVEDSVKCAAGADWVPRFESVLSRASEVVTATGERFAAGGVLGDYANLLLVGLAILESKALDTELVPLALWDGELDEGPWGTASIIGRWQDLGHRVEVIGLQEIVQRQISTHAAAVKDVVRNVGAESASREIDAEIMGILFADVVHFSQLTDRQIPLFVRHFLAAIGDLTGRSSHAPVVRNTWGDGLYLVFSTVRDAGLFALELCEVISSTDWAAKGLPSGLNIRVAVHAGPLFACTDPVTRQSSFTGRHVVRAARIEPITPGGLVYATRDFAALTAATEVREFSCDPVGRMPLAKQAGVVPVYVLRRNAR